MTAHKLLLHPQDPACAPLETVLLAGALREIGFIAAPVPVADTVFYPAGAQFLHLLSFLGCSPAIELDPPAEASALETARMNGSFCHVYLSCTDTLRFRADPRTAAPRCPACRRLEHDWRERIAAWQIHPPGIEWTCNGCGFNGRLTDLVFRKTAAFARSWVEVRGIYPSEAVPAGALLERLQAFSGCRWQYIYLQE